MSISISADVGAGSLGHYSQMGEGTSESGSVSIAFRKRIESTRVHKELSDESNSFEATGNVVVIKLAKRIVSASADDLPSLFKEQNINELVVKLKQEKVVIEEAIKITELYREHKNSQFEMPAPDRNRMGETVAGMHSRDRTNERSGDRCGIFDIFPCNQRGDHSKEEASDSPCLACKQEFALNRHSRSEQGIDQIKIKRESESKVIEISSDEENEQSNNVIVIEDDDEKNQSTLTRSGKNRQSIQEFTTNTNASKYKALNTLSESVSVSESESESVSVSVSESEAGSRVRTVSGNQTTVRLLTESTAVFQNFELILPDVIRESVRVIEEHIPEDRNIDIVHFWSSFSLTAFRAECAQKNVKDTMIREVEEFGTGSVVEELRNKELGKTKIKFVKAKAMLTYVALSCLSQSGEVDTKCNDRDTAMKYVDVINSKFIKEKGVEIRLDQFLKLKDYLSKTLFNGKRVGFDFDDLISLVMTRQIIKGRCNIVEALPDVLGLFVKDLLEKLYHIRTLVGLPLKNEHMKITKNGLNETEFSFLADILQPKTPQLNKMLFSSVHEVKKKAEKDNIIRMVGSVSTASSVLTNSGNMVKSLKRPFSAYKDLEVVARKVANNKFSTSVENRSRMGSGCLTQECVDQLQLHLSKNILKKWLLADSYRREIIKSTSIA